MSPRTSAPVLSILDAMADPALFAPWFAPESSWQAWRAFLAAPFGLPLSEAGAALYRAHTGRQTLPDAPAREAWLVVGRRGGKSRVAALIAVYLACFRDHRTLLAPGERGTMMVIAADRRQARVVFRYIAGLLDGVPMLAALVERRTKDAIHLVNGIVIEVHTANFRAVRGYTLIGAICDEIAFWRSDESANPDTEILNGLRPGMATVPGALLLCISSPYARRGALWEAYKAHWDKQIHLPTPRTLSQTWTCGTYYRLDIIPCYRIHSGHGAQGTATTGGRTHGQDHGGPARGALARGEDPRHGRADGPPCYRDRGPRRLPQDEAQAAG